MNLRKTILLSGILFFLSLAAVCQKAALKTNLISDAVTSPNIGVEFRMKPKWTMDISGQVNAWNINKRRWRHWMVMPEARYWFCETFQGNFLAVHALGGQYNVGNINTNVKFLGSDFSQMRDHRFQGWAVGAGIGYGYDWPLAKHWNMEFEIGIGWIYTRFDRYPCTDCGTVEAKDLHHNYYGPTKLSLAIEYIF